MCCLKYTYVHIHWEHEYIYVLIYFYISVLFKMDVRWWHKKNICNITVDSSLMTFRMLKKCLHEYVYLLPVSSNCLSACQKKKKNRKRLSSIIFESLVRFFWNYFYLLLFADEFIESDCSAVVCQWHLAWYLTDSKLLVTAVPGVMDQSKWSTEIWFILPHIMHSESTAVAAQQLWRVCWTLPAVLGWYRVFTICYSCT